MARIEVKDEKEAKYHSWSKRFSNIIWETTLKYMKQLENKRR